MSKCRSVVSTLHGKKLEIVFCVQVLRCAVLVCCVVANFLLLEASLGAHDVYFDFRSTSYILMYFYSCIAICYGGAGACMMGFCAMAELVLLGGPDLPARYNGPLLWCEISPSPKNVLRCLVRSTSYIQSGSHKTPHPLNLSQSWIFS